MLKKKKMVPKIITVPLETKEAVIEVDAKVPARLVNDGSPPDTFAPPNTTKEDSKMVEAQRETSRMWETTQMRIALWAVVGGFVVNALVTTTMIGVVLTKIIRSEVVTSLEFAILMTTLGNISGTSGIIIGFYFSRTNHTKIGGVGNKPANESR